MASRRDFLRMLGVGLGGTVLSSCGSSKHVGGKLSTPTGTSGVPLPNGYQFDRLYTPGGASAGPSELAPGCVMMNDQNQVIFYGQSGGQTGIYQTVFQQSRGRATSTGPVDTLVQQGQNVGGRQVDLLYPGDTNGSGSFALVIGTEGQPQTLFMRGGPTGTLEPIVTALTDVPGGAGAVFGAALGDVTLGQGNDILLVARYGGGGDGASTSQGAIYMPGASTNNGSIVASTSDQAPQSEGHIDSIGLIDMNEGGNYVLLAGVSGRSRAEMDGRLTRAVIQGQVGQPVSRGRLLTAAAGIGATRAEATGDTYGQPRVGPDNSTARLVHLSPENMVLYYRDVVIAQTGGLSPNGKVITSISPGVVNAVAGLCYYALYYEEGHELCVSNGQEHRTILSTGTVIDGKTVAEIFFGYHPEQTDSQGRIVVYVTYTDDTSGILLGFPA